MTNRQYYSSDRVARDVAQQVSGGSQSIFGLMVESHLVPGAQKFTPGEHNPSGLTYGQSITDACIGWEDSVTVLELLSEAVNVRRGVNRKA